MNDYSLLDLMLDLLRVYCWNCCWIFCAIDVGCDVVGGNYAESNVNFENDTVVFVAGKDDELLHQYNYECGSICNIV